MSRRRCCCVEGTGTGTASCTVFSDPFTRPNNQDVGPDWLESAGTGGPFRIADNKLAATGAAGETIECLHTIPGDVGTGTAAPDHFLVYATLGFDTDEDSGSALVGDGAARVELQRYAANRARLRIYDGATCKGSRSVPLYPANTVVVCVDGDLVHASLGAAELLSLPLAIGSSVTHLSATCAGTVTFDDYILSEHYYDDATCPDCRNEDCEWFTDSGQVSGDLSTVDYTATGTWDYWDNAIRGTADGTLQVAVSPPRGIIGSVRFSVPMGELMLHANEGAVVEFHYDSSDSFVRMTRDLAGGYPAGTVRVDFLSGGELFGFAWYVEWRDIHALHFRLCWDGTTFTAQGWRTGGVGEYGVATIQTVTLPHVPTEFVPRVVVSGLTSGYVLLDDIEADKDGDLIEPPRLCDECIAPSCPYCADGTYPRTVSVSFSGLTLRTDLPPGYEMPYDMSCPDPVTAELTAQEAIPFLVTRGGGCGWMGDSAPDNIPYYTCGHYPDITPGSYLTRLSNVLAWVSQVTGGYKLSVRLGTSATYNYALFELTVLGGRPNCMSDFDGVIPMVDCHQIDILEGSCLVYYCNQCSMTCTFTA